MKNPPFICSVCGEEYVKWAGKCRNCESWNTIEEVKLAIPGKKKKGFTSNPLSLLEIKTEEYKRYNLKSTELNNLFGGGITIGSSYLISGAPGIGKSTFLLEISRMLDFPVLYISGEETEQQIKNRCSRLKINKKDLFILRETISERIIEHIYTDKFKIVIIDSIQTMASSEFENSAGSVVQVRESASTIIDACKTNNITLFFTAHITKDGAIAGPKLLEHLVDGTIYMFGEYTSNSNTEVRLLRPLKNRFGSTDHLAIMEMHQDRFSVLKNEDLVINEGKDKHLGTVIYPHFFGQKMIFSEIEGLVIKTALNFPRRIAEGISVNRLHRLIAIMEKYLDVDLGALDVYVNISRGIRSEDTGLDLSIIAALFSSFHGIIIPANYIFFGEIGLNGAIKKISNLKSKIDIISSFHAYFYCANYSFSENITGFQIKNISNLMQFLRSITK